MFAAMTFENIGFFDLRFHTRYWAEVMLALLVLGILIGYVVALLRYRSPVRALKQTLGSLLEGLRDVATLPFGMRRIYAIASLSFKEALRRKVLYVFIMFLIPFLFAGWYLPNREEGQLLFLVAFVHSAMTWLLLPLVVFLVAMNFPNDLKLRTIQTIVTKPVRRLEIVVGRIIGFMAIFTLVLAVMGVISLLYLRGQISEKVFETQWIARVPIYAVPPDPSEAVAVDGFPHPLMFLKNGELLPSGTNVGKEYAYRSHVEGATGDEARFYFQFDPSEFQGAKTAKLQLTLDIFKTTKGDPTRSVGEDADDSGIFCNLRIYDREASASGDDDSEVPTFVFRVDHHRTMEIEVPAEAMKSGKVMVSVACLTRSQFLGMAPMDVYFLANVRSFDANFFKGLIAVWLKVLLLTTICVSVSTVLNGFVTILVAVMVYILGVNYAFMMGVITGEVQGGGPLESMIRLWVQTNQTVDLDPTFFNRLALNIDKGVLWMMDRVANVIPNLSSLDTVEFVAKGFDIPWFLIGQNVFVVFGYVIPVVLAGYFLLKSREIAA